MQSQYLYPAMKSARKTIPQIDDSMSIDRRVNVLDKTDIASIDSDRLNNRPRSTLITRPQKSPPALNNNLEISGIEDTQDLRFSGLKFQQHNKASPEVKRKVILLQVQSSVEALKSDQPGIAEEDIEQEDQDDSGLPVPFESYENKGKPFGRFNRSPLNAPDGRASKFKEPIWQKQCQRIAKQQQERALAGRRSESSNPGASEPDLSPRGTQFASPLEVRGNPPLGEGGKQISEAELRRRRGQRFNSRNRQQQTGSQGGQTKTRQPSTDSLRGVTGLAGIAEARKKPNL